MTDRARRIAPRRLSFNLEDFPEIEAERVDQNVNTGKGPTNDGIDNATFVTLGGTGSGVREELNLIGALETPATLVSEGNGAPHIVVPTAILQSIIASQRASRTWLLQAERGGTNMLFELEPPLTEEVLSTPYPVGYQSPSFRKFDGTSSAWEHLMCFLDDLGVHRDNKSLRLKEFSKSLAGRSFTWYTKLRPGSIRSWEELATEFYGKFLEEEGALHITDLGRVKQKNGESLISFIKHYRDRALHCKETLPEADLVYGCIKNIEDGSQIFLSLGGITTFVELMRRGADVVEAMKRQGKRTKEADNAFDVWALEDKGRKRNFWGPHSSKEYAQNNTKDLPPMPISRVQACKLIEEWLKDGTIQLKGNRTPLTKEQYDDPSYCVLHKTCYHTTMDCWTVRQTFQRQLKAGKILLPEKGGDVGDLHRRPLPDHGVNVITVADKEIRIEEIKEEDNDEEKLLSTGLAKTGGFRIMFSQLGLDQEAQKEAARALTRIIKEKRGELGAANAPLTRLARSHATAILFKEPSFQGAEFCHNRPLYVEACVEGVKDTPFNDSREEIPRKERKWGGKGVLAKWASEVEDLIGRWGFEGEISRTLLQPRSNPKVGRSGTQERKIEAIKAIRPPSSTKETQQLLGKLGYIRRFIPALGELINPLRGLLREKTPFVWGRAPHESFDQIKQVITSPQVMSPPVARHPLRLYVAVTNKSISGLIAQEVEGVERPVCYLSRVLKDVETRYPKQERYCLALVYVAQIYRHYFQAHTMEVMTKSEGIKYMLQNPSPTGRVSRWALMLSEYDLRVVHPQRLRSQALADMLAISSEGCEEHVAEETKGEMPKVNMCEGVRGKDWWTLQFDGTPANPAGGAGVVLSNEKGEVFAFSHHLSFPCTNNEVEYEALVLGLHMAKNLGVNKLRIRGDSNLVIRQIKGEYGTKEPSLAAYRDEVLKLIDTFEEVEAMHTPRAENRYADALATIGSKEIRESGEEIVIFRRVEQSSLAMIPHQERPEDWRNAIVEQLKQGICSKTTGEYQELCGALYRKTSDDLLMKCVSEEEGVRKMDNLHHAICGDVGPSFVQKNATREDVLADDEDTL
ncbi:Ribonuclease H domain [Sesbania bispinosa]|nr:Ribonuclease H domain [Sesbania bispinosa]